MAGWTMHRLVRAGARSDPGRFMLRLARDLGDLGLIDRGMTLAAHVFTSIIPILIVAGALRASLDARSGPIFAEHLGWMQRPQRSSRSHCRAGRRSCARPA